MNDLWRAHCVLNGQTFSDLFCSLRAAQNWQNDLCIVHGWDYGRGDRCEIKRWYPPLRTFRRGSVQFNGVCWEPA